MSAHTVNFRRSFEGKDARPLVDQVTIRTPADILPAAMVLEMDASMNGVRIMLWHDLATFAPMRDDSGQALNANVFGWRDDELGPWQNFNEVSRWGWVRACRSEGEVFRVNQQGIWFPWLSHLEGQVADFAVGLPEGAAVILPVHMPFGQLGAAILTSRVGSRSALRDCCMEFANRSAGPIRRFISGYARLMRNAEYLPPDTVLSEREIECLGWVARGKTDFEISIILGCSHAGVRYHLTRACSKLGAANRAQCVFRACQLGLLSPKA
jgi:DNA-binding CsgD family transcriptional regulator